MEAATTMDSGHRIGVHRPSGKTGRIGPPMELDNHGFSSQVEDRRSPLDRSRREPNHLELAKINKILMAIMEAKVAKAAREAPRRGAKVP